MYKSIPENLSNDDLTSVAYYVIKVLNKHKSKENKDVDFDKLPFKNTTPELNEICNNLLNEIGVQNLTENDVEIDKHINGLFLILSDRLKSESEKMKEKGKELLEKFGQDL